MNPKKCQFFLTELDFLSHHISACGIEPQLSKCKKILQWLTPNLVTNVWSFLGLVRYLAVFLPHLAEHTRILTPLTMKEAHKCFPKWETTHNVAFESIKALVCSPQCLTVINHIAPGENKIFLSCDASDWQTGATLSFGHTWETVYPVAYESAQLSGAEKNYPIHEKELLAIIWALKKWRSDLLGSYFGNWLSNCRPLAHPICSPQAAPDRSFLTGTMLLAFPLLLITMLPNNWCFFWGSGVYFHGHQSLKTALSILNLSSNGPNQHSTMVPFHVRGPSPRSRVLVQLRPCC